MLSWHEIVQKYIIRNSKKICKTTSPLRVHLGITYFTYHKIDSAGNYTVLLDRPDWAEKYVDQKIFLKDPYLRHPDHYEEGLTVIGHHGCPSYKKQILHEAVSTFDADTNLLLIQKHPSSVEFFGFCANSRKSSLQDIALNQPELLRSFGEYFKSEMQHVLEHMEGAFLPILKGKDFFKPEIIDPIKNHDAFLSEIGFKDLLKQKNVLAPRERDCLHFLAKGYKTKEIAARLKLSSRTVEFYLNNIKDKWGCLYLTDVRQITLKLQKFNLLP